VLSAKLGETALAEELLKFYQAAPVADGNPSGLPMMPKQERL